jgi:hypothetical protein
MLKDRARGGVAASLPSHAPGARAPSTPRRALLAAAAAAPVGVAGGARGAPHPDAAVIGLCAELERLAHQADALFTSSALDTDETFLDAVEAVERAQWQAMKQISVAPCRTADGVVAKLRAVALASPLTLGEICDRGGPAGGVIRSILGDVMGSPRQ